MVIDDTALRPVNNNLTLVRLVLASAVIVTHSYWRVTGIAGADPLSPLLFAPISDYAVDAFFFLSGFLVYQSLMRRMAVGLFAVARLARLLPGLALSVLVTVAAGYWASSAAGPDYFGGATAKFLATNLTFLGGSYSLTGVHCGDQALCVVNGSLWTLPWEARCYVVLAVLAMTGFAAPGRMLWLVLPLTAAGAIAWHLPGVQALALAIGGKGLVFTLTVADRLWPLFAAGITASLLRDRIRLSWTVLAALLAAHLLASWAGLELHTRTILVGYAVLCCGFLTARGGAISATWPDYSYGMYIYAFPVMMALAALWPFTNFVALAVATFAATVPLAAFSWHLVEEPVLALVRRRTLARRARQEMVPQPG